MDSACTCSCVLNLSLHVGLHYRYMNDHSGEALSGEHVGPTILLYMYTLYMYDSKPKTIVTSDIRVLRFLYTGMYN